MLRYPINPDVMDRLAEKLTQLILDDVDFENASNDYAFKILGLKPDAELSDQLMDQITEIKFQFYHKVTEYTFNQQSFGAIPKMVRRIASILKFRRQQRA